MEYQKHNNASQKISTLMMHFWLISNSKTTINIELCDINSKKEIKISIIGSYYGRKTQIKNVNEPSIKKIYILRRFMISKETIWTCGRYASRAATGRLRFERSLNTERIWLWYCSLARCTDARPKLQL